MTVKVARMSLVNSEKSPNLKAMCSIIIGDCIQVDGVMLKHSPERGSFYVQMPQHKSRSGEYSSIAHAITKEFAEEIKNEVVKAYNEGKKYTPAQNTQDGRISYSFSLKEFSKKSTNLAYGSMKLNDEFVVNGITVREGVNKENGEILKFISMPSRQDENGEWWSIVRPINEETKSAVNKYGLISYGNIASEQIGNISYKEMKENNEELSYFRHQNVDYAKKIGGVLNDMNVKWSGRIESNSVLMAVSADDADCYTLAVQTVRELAKQERAKTAETVQTAENVIDEEFFSVDAPEPF